MRCWILLLVFLVFSGGTHGQTPASRKLIYNLNIHNMLNLNPGVGFGLEYGIRDKVHFINNVQPKKSGGYNLVVNQWLIGLNTEFIYEFEKSFLTLGSLTAEFRRTTKNRKQIQVGGGPGYLVRFTNDFESIDHPLEPFLSGKTLIEHSIAPMAYAGVGKYRTGKRVLQFWHLRLSCYLPVSTLKPLAMLSLRLGMHKRPIE